MKSHALLIMISMTITISCTEDIVCGKSQWLDEEIETLKQYNDAHYLYVTEAVYKGMVVYTFRRCGPPNGFWMPPKVYNCYGNILGYLSETIDPDMLKHEKIYWQPDDFACSPKL